MQKLGLRTFALSSRRLAAMDFTRNPQNLPRQPVPPLQKTLEKYLKSTKPHLTAEEYENTKKLVERFGKDGGIGQKLQSLLEQRAVVKRNWLEEWWLNTAYLDWRDTIVVYYNPGLVMPLQNFKNQHEYLTYVARSMSRSLYFKRCIYSDKLPIDKHGKEELDMSQYKRIYSTCRIPGKTRDSLSITNEDNLVVIHKGFIYNVETVGADGVNLNVQQIADQFKKIISITSEENPYPVGILTSERRTVWADIHEKLSKDELNRKHLKKIRDSAVVICLDKNINDDKLPDQGMRQSAAVGMMIHGGGSKVNTCNRWFDKACQFIVSESGLSGIGTEHSPGEGQPAAVLMDYIFDDEVDKKISNEPSQRVIEPERLDFNLTPEIKQAINEAKNYIDKVIDTLLLNCFTFKGFGKDLIKSLKVSPDSFIQMAFQCAYYRQNKVPGAQYETAGLRKFIGGRTETIRSCSEESVNFAKMLFDDKVSSQVKIDALRKAIHAHKEYAHQAMNGFGVDRHLMGLKLLALENGIEVPELYNDVGFKKSSYMVVSTSQVVSKADLIMGFGPTVPDGYGICYNPHPNFINFGLSAYKHKNSDIHEFRKNVCECLEKMRQIFVQSKL